MLEVVRRLIDNGARELTLSESTDALNIKNTLNESIETRNYIISNHNNVLVANKLKKILNSLIHLDFEKISHGEKNLGVLCLKI